LGRLLVSNVALFLSDKLLYKDETWRIAANVAKPPQLSTKNRKATLTAALPPSFVSSFNCWT
jgi:hypothetical protein